MKKVVLSSVFILCVFVVIVAIKMPASFVLGQLANQTQAIYLESIQGSIWQGRAQHVQIKLPAGTVGRRAKVVHLGAVEWQLSFWRLLTGNVALQLNTEHPNQTISTHLMASYFDKSIEFDETRLEVDLPFALTFYPVPAKINGTAELNLQQLSVAMRDDMPFVNAIEGQLLVSQLNVAVTAPVELGDFGININSDDEGVIHATLSDVDATVSVSGKASLNQTSKAYSANGDITPTAKTDKMVTQALNFIAKKQADGRYVINYDGVLK
ncbi:MAG: type II secretion system protein N [Sinobacterium sp.]|nr:type II secretion system protein N [Sinobacterium sp.]